MRCMHRDIRGIEVQYQALGWLLMIGYKLIKEYPMVANSYSAALLLLKTAQGSRTDQCLQALTTGLERGIRARGQTSSCGEVRSGFLRRGVAAIIAPIPNPAP